MDNDKAFAIYALVLIAGVTSAFATSVMIGFATIPSPMTFIEHVSLGLMFRASYKWIGGFEWSDWAVTPEHMGEALPAEGMAHGGFTADATS